MYRQNNRGGNYASQNRSNNRFGRRPSFSRKSFGQTIPTNMFVKKSDPLKPEVAFIPTMKFSELNVHQILKENILKKGFNEPTPIQEGAIKHILEGKDLVGIANTGTGKTGAFLIPLIDKISKNPYSRVLIVVPTRELGRQIREELRSLSWGMNIYSTICIGGTPIRRQIFELRRNPHIIIGTPGRLKDLIERRMLNLSAFGTIVLDEVDRMVDMGFIHDIKYLVSLLPKVRQSLFFSATVPPQLESIMNTFLKDPIRVSVKTRDTAANVDQDIVQTQGNKMGTLESLLKNDTFKKVLIFGRTKRGVEKLSTSLFQKGFKVASIHGDKPQSQRQQAIRMFKEDVVSVLVATDVAARGIDIPNITHVINYDQPATYDDYIHRIGRTGRANQKGQALTFV